MNLHPYLVLIRPANVITAVSDVLAGCAIAGCFINLHETPLFNLILLLLSTSCLYSGGIVFNDIFDLNIDRIERPERPLPRGQVSLKNAKILAITLLLTGILVSFLIHAESGLIALLISLTALLYNRYTKDFLVIGPLNMGICRGLNLMLGMSVLSLRTHTHLIWICLIPVVFIAAITLTSKGEVLGNNTSAIVIALALDLVVTGLLLGIGFFGWMDLWMTSPFILFWIGMNGKAKIKAIVENKPEFVKMAVKMGVLSLIPLNASYVAGFGHWTLGLLVLLLLPISLGLAKRFAVT